MDWQMPEMSGIEALKELKKNEKTKFIPVIMLTATDSTTEAFENGAVDIVQKPFNKSELIARVKTSLELSNIHNELNQKKIEKDILQNKFKLQKDILVKQKKELNETRSMALKINQFISTSQNNISKILPYHFIINLPKNEIPSNFLWIADRNEKILISIGILQKDNILSELASLSIINFINEILFNSPETKDSMPSEIIHYLMEKNYETANEPFPLLFNDILFCSIDISKNILHYAGINLPIFVIKKDKLVELKTDIFDGNLSNLKITNHNVQLSRNDTIYILNDGFKIQGNDINEKGYISERIIDLLKKIHKKDLIKQKILLEKTFSNWGKNNKQIHDIIAFGIRI